MYGIHRLSPSEADALGEKIRMEALAHQQAEDDLTEAVLVIRHHFEKSDAHRF